MPPSTTEAGTSTYSYAPSTLKQVQVLIVMPPSTLKQVQVPIIMPPCHPEAGTSYRPKASYTYHKRYRYTVEMV